MNHNPANRSLFVALMISSFIGGGLSRADSNAPSRRPDVHFVPTPNEVVEIMLRLADVKADDIVYDLGCGDGRIVIATAKKAGARSYGFDIDPAMVETSLENVARENLEHLVTIEEKDIFDLDLSGASVITLYLLPGLNDRLVPQLERLKPGSRIVSHEFDIEGLEADVEAIVNLDDYGTSKVYLWTTPLKKIITARQEVDEEWQNWWDSKESEAELIPVSNW